MFPGSLEAGMSARPHARPQGDSEKVLPHPMEAGAVRAYVRSTPGCLAVAETREVPCGIGGGVGEKGLGAGRLLGRAGPWSQYRIRRRG